MLAAISLLALARRAEARALRFGVSWAETETSPGNYDGSKLDVILNTA